MAPLSSYVPRTHRMRAALGATDQECLVRVSWQCKDPCWGISVGSLVCAALCVCVCIYVCVGDRTIRVRHLCWITYLCRAVRVCMYIRINVCLCGRSMLGTCVESRICAALCMRDVCVCVCVCMYVCVTIEGPMLEHLCLIDCLYCVYVYVYVSM